MPERTAPQALALARRARVRARDGPNHSRRMETGHPSGGLFCGSAEAVGLRSPARAQRVAGLLRRQYAEAGGANWADLRTQREDESPGWPERVPLPALCAASAPDRESPLLCRPCGK